jgi:hypothetical protein
MKLELAILRAVERSTEAYNLYKEHKMYYQALRIYKANTRVYELLVQFSSSCDEAIVQDVNHFIFHLEDWFEQFNKFAKQTVQLEDVFVFERLKNSIPFPSDFIDKLNSL